MVHIIIPELLYVKFTRGTQMVPRSSGRGTMPSSSTAMVALCTTLSVRQMGAMGAETWWATEATAGEIVGNVIITLWLWLT